MTRNTLAFIIRSVLSVSAIAGCSIASLKVNSTPNAAEVFLENTKTGEKKSLGKTPLSVPISSVRETAGGEFSDGEYFLISIEKSGFKDQRLSIPLPAMGSFITELDVKMKEGELSKNIQSADDIINHLFLAQKFALAKETERAQIELDSILSVAPNFTRAQSMRASIFYIQKKFEDSLKWYELVLKSDPKNEEAIKMIAKIRSEGRLPSSKVAQ